jgi:hypothetical protein
VGQLPEVPDVDPGLAEKLANLPSMVAGVNSNNVQMQLESTMQFRKLLSEGQNPPIDAVGAPRGVFCSQTQNAVSFVSFSCDRHETQQNAHSKPGCLLPRTTRCLHALPPILLSRRTLAR